MGVWGGGGIITLKVPNNAILESTISPGTSLSPAQITSMEDQVHI